MDPLFWAQTLIDPPNNEKKNEKKTSLFVCLFMGKEKA